MPEHLKTREDIIAWVISLMADPSKWEKDNTLGTQFNFVYTPLVPLRDPDGGPGVGSLYINRREDYPNSGGYYLGIYGQTAIYVAATWSLKTMLFDPLGRKFRDAIFRIAKAVKAKEESESRESHRVNYAHTLECMSALMTPPTYHAECPLCGVFHEFLGECPCQSHHGA